MLLIISAFAYFVKYFIAISTDFSSLSVPLNEIKTVKISFYFSVIIALVESLVGLPYAPKLSANTGNFSIFIISFPIP